MKKLTIISALIFASIHSFAQPVIGMGAGFTTAKTPVYNLNIGFKFSERSLVYYNQNIQLTRNSSAPQMLGMRYGYNIGSVQINAGADYHLLSSDHYKSDKPAEKFYPAFGIAKYFKQFPVKIDVSMSGRYGIVCIGIYKMMD